MTENTPTADAAPEVAAEATSEQSAAPSINDIISSTVNEALAAQSAQPTQPIQPTATEAPAEEAPNAATEDVDQADTAAVPEIGIKPEDLGVADTTEAQPASLTEAWPDLGSDAGNGLIGLLDGKATEADVNEIFGDAWASGDINSVNVEKLTELVGERNARTCLTLAETHYKDVVASVTTTVFDAVGGQEQWGVLANYLNSMPTEKREGYMSQISKGGDATAFAAKALLNDYNSNPNNTPVRTQAAAGAGLEGHATPQASTAPDADAVANAVLKRMGTNVEPTPAQQGGDELVELMALLNSQ